MKDLMRRLWKEEDGQGMAEYALIIALVAILLIVALTFLKDGIAGVFNEAGTEMNDATA